MYLKYKRNFPGKRIKDLHSFFYNIIFKTDTTIAELPLMPAATNFAMAMARFAAMALYIGSLEVVDAMVDICVEYYVIKK